ncbi:hypothetical protein TGRUB_269775 [Toxoplasma gondii RUB]|uniref:Uncharacterized protein n=1 Tax=Toxoplasma gondii RUB TaxID=935652 RepID=A0A086LY31_TOXGO|nr:hypothetical protein TGRUB_269775 [Toxoplasma gondii RUB]
MITRLLSANSSPKVTHFRGVLSANVLSRLSIKTVGRDNIMFSGCKSLFQSHFIHFRGVQPRCNEGTTATKSQLRASVLPQSHPDRHVLALLFPTKQSAEMFHVAENGSRTNSSSFVHRWAALRHLQNIAQMLLPSRPVKTNKRNDCVVLSLSADHALSDDWLLRCTYTPAYSSGTRRTRPALL